MAEQVETLREEQLLQEASSTASDIMTESELSKDESDSDPVLEAIRARIKEIEAEAELIKQMETEVFRQIAGSTTGLNSVHLLSEEKEEIDARSVYVGNVYYGASAKELESHFRGCGAINRVTILRNKSDGHPKGFAYIEFGSKDFVETALAMNDTFFHGRKIKVMSKRTNKPGLSTTNRFARGSFRGRGGRVSRGAGYQTSFRGTRRSMRGYRGRAYYYSPY